MKPAHVPYLPAALATTLLACALLARADEPFVQDLREEPYRPLVGLDWKLPENATREGDILTVRSLRNAKGMLAATAQVDLSAYCGRGVQLRIRARAENVSRPPASYLGFKFMMPYRNLLTGVTDYPQATAGYGTFDWKEHEFGFRLKPGQAKTATLTLGLQEATGIAQFDLSTLEIRPFDGLFRRINQDFRVAYPSRVQKWPQLRGVMLPGGRSTEKDFADLHDWGATLVRYQMTSCYPGYTTGAEIPTDAYERWLTDRLGHLERDILPWARKYGIKVIVDLHQVPGGRYKNKNQRLLTEKRHLDAFVDVWKRIATRFRGNEDVIYGYDLINEPNQTAGKAPFDYWTIQRLAAEAVRAIDPETPIIVESNCMDSPGAFEYLSPLEMDNVIYQVHMYTPGSYTHQLVHGVISGKDRPRYPDQTKRWDIDMMRRTLADVRSFQLRHNARILVGEFSAAAWAKGAEHYLRDCIAVFAEYGWDWTYHAFREWPGWSVEHEGTSPSDMHPSADNPRMRVLKRGLRGR